MWRHEDVFFGAMGGAGGGGKPITTPEEIAERCLEARTRCVPACPFMHGTAHWMAFSALFTGGTVVIPAEHRLDALQALGARRARAGQLHGDRRRRVRAADARRARHRRRPRARRVGLARAALGRRDPLADAQARARRAAARACSSSTATARRRPAARASRWWCPAATSRPRRSSACPTTRSCSATISGPRPPGVIGRLARRGPIPLGYYKDPEKTAATFPVVDGVRWAVPGDHAVADDDGLITLLGRGSVSINTRRREGVPRRGRVGAEGPRRGDRRGGGRRSRRTLGRTRRRRRAAAARHRPRRSKRSRPTPGEHLARYKMPREIVFVDAITRSPSGKPDYRWAKATAIDAGAADRHMTQPSRRPRPARTSASTATTPSTGTRGATRRSRARAPKASRSSCRSATRRATGAT